MPDRSLNGFGFGFPSLPSFPPQSATSVFSHVDFPQLFQLFHCYLWIAAWENNASSCFGHSMDDVPSFNHFLQPGTPQFLCLWLHHSFTMISEGQDNFFKNSGIIYLVLICWNPLWPCCLEMRWSAQKEIFPALECQTMQH